MSTTTTNTNINTNTNTNHHHKQNIPLPPSRATATTQACASCRYQRRKCAPDCILAPYFPHDRQRQFQNAHKLFGVSNITKIIKHLDQPHRDEAMRTIIFQSDVRAQDPVGGCYRVIRELQRQIDFNRAELEIVLHQLAICRAQAVQNQTQHHLLVTDPLDLTACSYDDTVADQVVLDYSSNINNSNNHGENENDHNINDQVSHDQYINLQGNDQDDHNNQGGVNVVEDDHVAPLHEINAWAMQNSDSGHLEVKQSCSSCVDDCEDFKRLMINEINIPPAGERRHQFKFEFEDINEHSCEETIAMFNEENHKAIIKEENGSFQHNQDHDLKGAATLFTLTY